MIGFVSHTGDKWKNRMKLFVVFAIKEILMKQGYVLIVWIEKEAGVMR